MIAVGEESLNVGPPQEVEGFDLDRLEPVDGGTRVTSIYDWSAVDEQWNRGDGTWPIVPEFALKATLGILERTVAPRT